MNSAMSGASVPLVRTQPRSIPMSTTGRGEPIEILLVEDDLDHADLTMMP